jgi:glyoxylase-like metal-dependent hydrolase (beta-lactamase superfamily II)
MEQIGRGIYFENAFSGVTLGGLILPHGTVFIDAPLRAEEGRAWRTALQNLGGSGNRLLINLDAHPDRTLGARVMECTIIAHQKTAQVFRSRPSVFKGQNAESGAEWETYDEAVGTRWAVPDITFNSRIELHWGQCDVILEHHPGPTPGAIWVAIPFEKILFVGDAVLAEQPPFMANADIPEWINSLDFLVNEYQNFTIVSGRGGTIPYEFVHKQRQHLKLVQKNLEKIAHRDVTPESIEKIIPALLEDLTFPAQLEDQYIQRLRHGLTQYFTRHYRPSEATSANLE